MSIDNETGQCLQGFRSGPQRRQCLKGNVAEFVGSLTRLG
jgi:hypothetical protein